jgi:YfiH family protein
MSGIQTIATLPADWPAPAGIRAFTTLRTGPGASRAPFDRFNLGLRSGDEPAAAQANRDALRAAIGTLHAPRWLHQVHGIDVVRALAGDAADAEATADAAVTVVPGLPLAILTADCLPVLFAAEDGSEVGAAHAGWPGLSAGVLEATLAAMRTPPARLMAWIGPGAGPQRYEVGENVYAAFVYKDAPAAAHFLPTRPGHWLADLPALARRRLAAAGVQRVFGGGECTISDPARWYSYRRDGATGRMASLIWINPDRSGPAQA